jgi:hypothetical protein
LRGRRAVSVSAVPINRQKTAPPGAINTGGRQSKGFPKLNIHTQGGVDNTADTAHTRRERLTADYMAQEARTLRVTMPDNYLRSHGLIAGDVAQIATDQPCRPGELSAGRGACGNVTIGTLVEQDGRTWLATKQGRGFRRVMVEQTDLIGPVVTITRGHAPT